MDYLLRPDVLLVFTYAPAGLGHLRVTDALHDGLPEGAHSVLLGADDTRITYWHRLMSINPALRGIMEWFQLDAQQQWFSKLYVFALAHVTGHLYRQMEHLIREQWADKKIMVVLSTHFGLAHQIAAIRRKLEKNFNMKIILVVQVTDATSMKIWYVDGADLIVVPSEKVKQELAQYAPKNSVYTTDIAVLPYPLGKTLMMRLTTTEYTQRLQEYTQGLGATIHVVVPVSGAAVGLGYYTELIDQLARRSARFRIHLVAGNSVHTAMFINSMKARGNVLLVSGSSDKEIVDNYEKVYGQDVIALEIVKPSEQSFKALLSPDQRGGVILLFTAPVGKQEEDNLRFLIDHKLIPGDDQQQKLYDDAASGKTQVDMNCPWRALRLTNDPARDVAFIGWCIHAGVFSNMAIRRDTQNPDPELAANGVSAILGKSRPAGAGETQVV